MLQVSGFVLLILTFHFGTGRPAPLPSSGLKKNTKMDILAALLDDKNDGDAQGMGNSKVENNINLNLQGFHPASHPYPYKNPSDIVSQLPNPAGLSNPVPVPSHLYQVPVVPSNPFHGLAVPYIPYHDPAVQYNPYQIPVGFKPKYPSQVGPAHPYQSHIPNMAPYRQVIHRHIDVHETRPSLKRQHVLHRKQGPDYSKVTDILKQIARDKRLSFEKKQKLFNTAFALLPSQGEILGGPTTVDVIKILHKNLEKEEIPLRYRIDLEEGSTEYVSLEVEDENSEYVSSDPEYENSDNGGKSDESLSEQIISDEKDATEEKDATDERDATEEKRQDKEKGEDHKRNSDFRSKSHTKSKSGENSEIVEDMSNPYDDDDDENLVDEDQFNSDEDASE